MFRHLVVECRRIMVLGPMSLPAHGLSMSLSIVSHLPAFLTITAAPKSSHLLVTIFSSRSLVTK